MTSALIAASRGAGLTTFVGLLYTAQVRLGTEAPHEAFRFHADHDTLRELERLYVSIGAGRFPLLDIDWEERRLSFLLRFSAPRRPALFGRRGAGGGGGEGAPLRVGGITTEELVELGRHDSSVSEATSRSLHSQVVVLLFDASRLRTESEGPFSRLLAEGDQMSKEALEILARYLFVEPSPKARTMHPLLVFTKFDQLPGAASRELGVPPGPPSAWPPEERQRIGRGVLERFLPKTGSWLLAPSRRETQIAVEAPLFYYSSLRVEETPEGPRIARRSRLPVGGWEPDYPFEEYRALLERMGWLARRLPDLDGGT